MQNVEIQTENHVISSVCIYKYIYKQLRVREGRSKGWKLVFPTNLLIL